MSQKKICFIAPNSHLLFSGRKIEKVEGPDVHQYVLGKELSKRGHFVSYISTIQNGKLLQYDENIRFIGIGNSTKRSFLSLLFNYLRILISMKKSQADIFFYAGGQLGVFSVISRLRRKKFLYFVSSDFTVKKKKIEKNDYLISQKLISWINSIDIKFATKIIVQNSYQKRNVKKNYSRESLILKIPIPKFEVKSEPNKKDIVLWVGTISEIKQPEIFLEICKRLPKIHFIMVGGASEKKTIFNNIIKQSGEIENLSFLGCVPLNKIDLYFSISKILVNTSEYEGYPISFNQAWSYGMPIVSLKTDPDDLIKNKRMGFVSGSIDNMVDDINKIISNKKLYNDISYNSKKFIENNYNLEKIIDNYIELF